MRLKWEELCAVCGDVKMETWIDGMSGQKCGRYCKMYINVKLSTLVGITESNLLCRLENVDVQSILVH